MRLRRFLICLVQIWDRREVGIPKYARFFTWSLFLRSYHLGIISSTHSFFALMRFDSYFSFFSFDFCWFKIMKKSKYLNYFTFLFSSSFIFFRKVFFWSSINFLCFSSSSLFFGGRFCGLEAKVVLNSLKK